MANPLAISARTSTRLAGALRVAALLSVLSAGLSCWCLRSAYAETEQRVWQLGQQLLADLGPTLVGEPQSVLINGQPLFVASRQSELSVGEVLDRFAVSCIAPDAQLALPPELRDPSAPEAARSLLDDPARFGVMRAESEAGGQLACLARRGQPRGLSALVDDVHAFLDSGDLSQLGDLRYVTARKLASGRTQVLAVWSEGALRIGALFPERGDAPGSDMQLVARPPQSTRTLCALAPGRSFGLRLYDSQRSAREVLAFYDRTLPEAGWQPLPLMLDERELRDGVFARAFTRDGQAIALGVEIVGAQAQGELDAAGGSAISLIDLGSVRHTSGHAAVE